MPTVVTPWGNKRVAWRNRQCKEQCQMHAGEEDHAQHGRTKSIHGQDSPWKSQPEWQRREINGESMTVVWPTHRGRLENRTDLSWRCWMYTFDLDCRPRCAVLVLVAWLAVKVLVLRPSCQGLGLDLQTRRWAHGLKTIEFFSQISITRSTICQRNGRKSNRRSLDH